MKKSLLSAAVVAAMLVVSLPAMAADSAQVRATKAAKIVEALKDDNFASLANKQLRIHLYDKLGIDLGGNIVLQEKMRKYSTEDTDILGKNIIQDKNILEKQPIQSETNLSNLTNTGIIIDDIKDQTIYKQDVVLIYKCDKAVLTCQNSNNDIPSARAEFEKELYNHYGKRFVIKRIIYDPNQFLEKKDAFLAMVKPDENILIVKITLEGQGLDVKEFQNAFGAKIGATVPTTKVHVVEGIFNAHEHKEGYSDYGVKDYSAYTYALGNRIYTQTDPRKLVKNNIRGCIRDICRFYGDQVNKYANPVGYQNEINRYSGRFYDLKK